jgi:hypothetical protein
MAKVAKAAAAAQLLLVVLAHRPLLDNQQPNQIPLPTGRFLKLREKPSVILIITVHPKTGGKGAGTRHQLD